MAKAFRGVHYCRGTPERPHKATRMSTYHSYTYGGGMAFCRVCNRSVSLVKKPTEV